MQQLCVSLTSLTRTLTTLQETLQETPNQETPKPAEASSASNTPASSDDFGVDAKAIEQQSTQLQGQFQQILANLNSCDLPPTVEMRLRPLQTESHRRLRLLGIEAIRLRTAKQATTLAKVQSQLSGHLAQLIQFADAMAKEVCSLDEQTNADSDADDGHE